MAEERLYFLEDSQGRTIGLGFYREHELDALKQNNPNCVIYKLPLSDGFMSKAAFVGKNPSKTRKIIYLKSFFMGFPLVDWTFENCVDNYTKCVYVDELEKLMEGK